MKLDDEVISELEHNLLMFYTGIKRDARDILSEQQKKISGNSKKVEKAAVANGPVDDPDDAVERMHKIKRIGIESAKALEKGDLRRFGELLDEHWKAKRGITSSMSNDKIDRWYSIGKSNGAIGAKLIGAGGGGFMLFYCEDGKHQLRKALVNEGLEEHRFRFEFEGAKVVYNT